MLRALVYLDSQFFLEIFLDLLDKNKISFGLWIMITNYLVINYYNYIFFAHQNILPANESWALINYVHLFWLSNIFSHQMG